MDLSRQVEWSKSAQRRTAAVANAAAAEAVAMDAGMPEGSRC